MAGNVTALAEHWGCTMSVVYERAPRNLFGEQHMRISMKSMPYLRIAWNLQWGRQKRSLRKLVNSEAGAEQSKASSR